MEKFDKRMVVATAIALAVLPNVAIAQSSRTVCNTVGRTVNCDTTTKQDPAPLDYGRILQEGRDSVPEYKPREQVPAQPQPMPSNESPALWKALNGLRTGNDLLIVCTDEGSGVGAIACMSFIRGVTRGFMGGVTYSQKPAAICPPETATSGQIRDVVVKSLRDDPAERHKSADFLVVKSLLAAFPCSAG